MKDFKRQILKIMPELALDKIAMTLFIDLASFMF